MNGARTSHVRWFLVFWLVTGMMLLLISTG